MSNLKTVSFQAAGIVAVCTVLILSCIFLLDKFMDYAVASQLEKLQAQIPGLTLRNELRSSSLLARTGRLFFSFQNSLPGEEHHTPLQGAADYQYSITVFGARGTFAKAADYGNLDQFARARVNLEPLNFDGDFFINGSGLRTARVRIAPASMSISALSCRLSERILAINAAASPQPELSLSAGSVNCRLDQESGDTVAGINKLRLAGTLLQTQPLKFSQVHLTFDSLNVETRPHPGAAAAAVAGHSYTLSGGDHILGIRDVDSSGMGVLYASGSIRSIRENPGSAERRLMPEFSSSGFDAALEKIDTSFPGKFLDPQTPSFSPDALLELLFSPQLRLKLNALHLESSSGNIDASGTLQARQDDSSALTGEFKLRAAESLLRTMPAAGQQQPGKQSDRQLDEALSAGMLTCRDGSCETTLSIKEGQVYLNGQLRR